MFAIIQLPARQNAFTFIYTQFAFTDFNKVLSIIQASVRIFMAVVVLGSLNTANLILFKKRYQNRLMETTTTLTKPICKF